jgi:hypothetical protein
VAALRDALQEGLSISSAVSRAREALSADTSVLVGALSSYELDRADGAMEAALALRSVERSVEEVPAPLAARDRREARLRQRALGPSPPSGPTTGSSARSASRRRRCGPPPCSSATPPGTSSTPDALALRSLQLFAVAPARESSCCRSPAWRAWPTSSACSARSSS